MPDMRRTLRGFWSLTAIFFAFFAAPAFAAVCAPATSQGTAPSTWQTYCWLDFSTYNDTTARSALGQNFSYTLSDGAILTFNLKATSTAATAAAAIAAPSWTGAAVGNSAFLGIPNSPILYMANSGSTVTFTISSILVTPPPGAPAVTAYAFVAADAESTDNTETIQFVTNGGNWQLLDSVPPITGATMPTQNLAGTTFTTTGGGATGDVGGYIVGTNSPTTVTATMTGQGLQGVMFAVRFASIRLNKQIAGARIDPADQFKFDIIATGNSAVLATGTTTGTANGPFTAAAVSLASGIPLTITESMATGSVSALSRYRSQLSCTNGVTGSSTVLPTNLTTTSYNFGALQFGDAIQCVFTNTAYPQVRVVKALGSSGRLFATDQFTVRLRQGTTVIATTTTTGTGTTVTNGATPLTQVTAGTAYNVNEVGAGTTDLAQYTVALNCTNRWAASSTTLPTALGTAFTPQLGDTIVCTITNTRRANNATLTIVKSSTVISNPINGTTNPKAIPGAIVRYSLLVSNSGTLTVTSNSVFIIDTLPPQLRIGTAAAPTLIQGTPTSNLTLTPASDVRYSNQTTAPATFAACSAAPHNYTPVAAYDANVRHICVRPQGSMAGNTGSGQPNFTITFQGQVP